MLALDEGRIAQIVARAQLSEDHPLASFAITDDLQEAALGSAIAARRLLRRARTPNISVESFRRAREQADEIGRLGEELVAIHLSHQTELGIVSSFEWVSETNAVAPMDFRLLFDNGYNGTN